MPLGERAGFEKSQSRYCGVETEFNDNVPQLLNFNLSTGAFDFVVAPLMNPSYRPSLLEKGGVLPFAASDLVLSPSPWSSHVVGKISSWIDLDSEDETLRMDSETTLKQEIAWANHLSIQVWYEWCVTSPDPSAIHNSSGRSYWEGCQSDELRVAWMEPILIHCACPNTDLDGTYEAVSKCSI